MRFRAFVCAIALAFSMTIPSESAPLFRDCGGDSDCAILWGEL